MHQWAMLLFRHWAMLWSTLRLQRHLAHLILVQNRGSVKCQWCHSALVEGQATQAIETLAPPKPTTSQSEDATATSEPYHFSLEDWETFIAWVTLCTPLSVWICVLLFDCIIQILGPVNSWECLFNFDCVRTLGQNNFWMLSGALWKSGKVF